MTDYIFTFSETTSARLDLFIAKSAENLTRSNVQKLIEANNVLVNNEPKKANYRLIYGDKIEINIPKPKKSEIAAEDIPLDIIYEDSDVLVINKPAGLTVHPAPGNEDGTLVNAILAHSDDLSGIGGVERPGIVHRLDKDTSGLLVIAKNDASHLNLQQQIQSREAKRRYKALVWGKTTFTDAEVDAPIGRHPTDRQKMAVIKDTEKI